MVVVHAPRVRMLDQIHPVLVLLRPRPRLGDVLGGDEEGALGVVPRAAPHPHSRLPKGPALGGFEVGIGGVAVLERARVGVVVVAVVRAEGALGPGGREVGLERCLECVGEGLHRTGVVEEVHVPGHDDQVATVLGPRVVAAVGRGGGGVRGLHTVTRRAGRSQKHC